MPGPDDSAALTAGDVLARLAALPRRSFAEEFSHARIAVLAPHPDDESLGCGGLIAAACAAGQPPLVLVLTDGAASHPGSLAYPPARLRSVRELETMHAAAALGLPAERVVFLRYPDTAAPGDGRAAEMAASRIGGILAGSGCDTLLAPWRHDPHGDHEAAAALARIVTATLRLRLLSYPVWGLTLPPEQLLADPPLDGFRLDIRACLARKRAAIRAHRSQYAGLIEDDPTGFQMSEAFMALFLSGEEIFMSPGRA